MKIFFYFIGLLMAYFCVILIFMTGFLLKRTVIKSNSSCDEMPSLFNRLVKQSNNTCWTVPRYKKAIIILIDALRYDFVKTKIMDSKNNKIYHNCFKNLNDILDKSPNNAMLFKFIADPPTTTLQRLKGLTTGSLPTFVDAGSNFASPEISEDNFIDQFIKSKKKIFFAGDDTWGSLFPHRFTESYQFPSFNVKDLDTVDNGVIEHLLPALKKDKHQIYIGHMLGVDHCGHTFGPNHLIMAEKLSLVDGFIKQIVDEIDNETILFVLGDHGMTEDGNHGGDSNDEVTAALYVYSKLPFVHLEKVDKVEQVDFVPTISLLLGLPIPFQSLGSYISTLTPLVNNSHLETQLQAVKALRINVLQVLQYVQAYNKETSLLTNDKMQTFESSFNDTENDFQMIIKDIKQNISNNTEILKDKMIDLELKYRKIIIEIIQLCRQVWAQFDTTLISISILIMLIALVFNIAFVFTGPNSILTFKVFFVMVYAICFLVVFIYWIGIDIIPISLCFVCSLFIYMSFVRFIIAYVKCNDVQLSINAILGKPLDYVSFAFYLAYISSFFSNSYVVYEGQISKFFLVSSILFHLIYFLKVYYSSFYLDNKTYSKKQNLKITIPISYFFKLFLIVLVIFFCIGMSSIFRICREEDANCTLSDYIQSFSPFNANNNLSVQNFCIACLSVMISSLLLYNFLRRNGNLYRHTLLTYSAYALPVFSMILIAHWCMQLMIAQQDTTPIYLARAILVYGVFCLILPFITDPIMTYMTPQKTNNIPALLQGRDISVPELFKILKNDFKSNSPTEPTLLAYGLNTMLSSVHQVMLGALTLLLCLLLSPSHSPPLILAACATFTFIHFVASSNQKDEISYVPWSSVIVFSLLGSVFFHTTGHEATIASIRWEAAFYVTTPDSFSILSALLVLANTFASHIFTSFASPLLLYSQVQQIHLVQNSELLSALVLDLSLKNIFVYALRLFAMMLVATVHKRHLMVWKIFAPRLVYEIINFIIIVFINIINIGVIGRLKYKINSFLNELHTSVGFQKNI